MAAHDHGGGIDQPKFYLGGTPPNQLLATARTNYLALQKGALIHFNMGTFHTNDFPGADVTTDTFAPTGLDIDQWLDACVDAGMDYATLTTKHHDGFALWPTAYHYSTNPIRSVAQTTWYANNGQIDIVSQFVAKCRTRGLSPCLYYSIWDKTLEAQSGTAEYLTMVKAQLTELLTDYGDITAIWFDGWGWQVGYATVPYWDVYDHVKSLQPSCLVIENNHTHPTVNSDIEVYEFVTDGSIPAANTRPAEETATARVDGSWFFHTGADVTDAAFTAAATILSKISNANSNTATYNLGIMPNTAGVLPAALVTRLGQLGA